MVDDIVYENLVVAGKRWHVSSSGYVVRFVGRKSTCLHRIITECPDNQEVDHIDGNKLNNQRSNLRLCNKVQNQGNRNGSRKSGFKGTICRKRNRLRPWEAYITKGGKVTHLGSFVSEIDAAKAYNAAAVEYFGEFAKLNAV